MSELKEELKKDEFTDVVTYLNSGNVIFSVTERTHRF
ncbi:DUF1697 domain-containing protein [Enterococcus gallinarum]|nr:DUF1697 domain-containing protein [Enterococcus gallinarum]